MSASEKNNMSASEKNNQDADEVVEDIAVEAEADSVDSEEQADPVVQTPARQPALSWLRRNLVPAVAATLVVASAVAAASVYWWLYRPDRMTDAAARDTVISAAKEGTEALLSYSPENLDADLANAKSHLTGEFLDYYSDFTDKVVAPASRSKGVKTEANVARAAVSDMRPGKADVLVFVNQVTTSKERPTPALSTSSVMVTLVRSADRWLISGFNPV
jgi:Mce-associated membrane protein